MQKFVVRVRWMRVLEKCSTRRDQVVIPEFIPPDLLSYKFVSRVSALFGANTGYAREASFKWHLTEHLCNRCQLREASLGYTVLTEESTKQIGQFMNLEK